MLRVTNCNIPLDYTEKTLTELTAKKLRIPASQIRKTVIAKKSVDARDKGDVHFVMSLDVQLIPGKEDELLRKAKPGTVIKTPEKKRLVLPKPAFSRRPVVIGAGPAGLFAALMLARAGADPILLERGKCVEDRTRDVEILQQSGTLDPESNVQFGEGGAGAFSDGKLTTGIKSPYQSEVLETFVEHGAPEEILILQKPHIGTDLLKGVVASIRREIIRLGGEVHFSACMTGILLSGGKTVGVTYRQDGETRELRTDAVLLCIGHSARDTVQALYDQGIIMEQKPFAMGVRIEHPQEMISRSQYGKFAKDPALKAADYKLAVRTPDGRGCYTFCMCPGGEVIAAASETGRMAVNGMSYHARDGVNANAALLVGVRPEDFGGEHPLAGMKLQRSIEEAAFRIAGGGYRAPVQRAEDFLAGRETKALGSVRPTLKPGVTPADLRACLPGFIVDDLKIGIREMDRQLHGFAMPDALLTGVETRSSSPVRLPRGDDRMSLQIEGLYPVGEGAGYAGGIVSAAVDGIAAAVSAMERSAAR